MCLSYVTEQYDTPSSCITDGWKAMYGTTTKPQLYGMKDVPIDEWFKANTAIQIKADDGKNYESGFHVWKDETKTRAAENRRRVFVRFISALGSQDGEQVVIAREMYIPSSSNGWPPKPGEEPPKK